MPPVFCASRVGLVLFGPSEVRSLRCLGPAAADDGAEAFRMRGWSRGRGADGSGVVAVRVAGAESAALGPRGTVVGFGLGTASAPVELVDSAALGMVGAEAGCDAPAMDCATSVVTWVIAEFTAEAALVAIARSACPTAVMGSADGVGVAAVAVGATVEAASVVTGTGAPVAWSRVISVPDAVSTATGAVGVRRCTAAMRSTGICCCGCVAVHCWIT